jgi:hypothetical protein
MISHGKRTILFIEIVSLCWGIKVVLRIIRAALGNPVSCGAHFRGD